MNRLLLAPDLCAQIEADARAAWPRECCGLLEGTRHGDTVAVAAVHPVRNAAEGADAFEIDPALHFAVLRAARARGQDIVGCYHSHPGGGPAPSARDLQGAGEAGFVWLIAALGRPDAVTLRAYLFDGNGFLPVPLAVNRLA